MSLLTLFGLFAVTGMLICDALHHQHKHRSILLVYAVFCFFGSAYGFLQGAWPFGLVEAIWGFLKIYQWWSHRHPLEG